MLQEKEGLEAALTHSPIVNASPSLLPPPKSLYLAGLRNGTNSLFMPVLYSFQFHNKLVMLLKEGIKGGGKEKTQPLSEIRLYG